MDYLKVIFIKSRGIVMRDIKFRAWDNATEKFRHTEKGLLTNLYQKLKSRNAKTGMES